MLTNAPVAPLILTSSSNGFDKASSTALIALFSPSPSPIPIIALPIFLITILTSAKSRLIKPGQTFVAIKGYTVDGHDYIEDAIKNGATAVIAQKEVKCDVPVIGMNQMLFGNLLLHCKNLL